MKKAPKGSNKRPRRLLRPRLKPERFFNASSRKIPDLSNNSPKGVAIAVEEEVLTLKTKIDLLEVGIKREIMIVDVEATEVMTVIEEGAREMTIIEAVKEVVAKMTTIGEVTEEETKEEEAAEQRTEAASEEATREIKGVNIAMTTREMIDMKGRHITLRVIHFKVRILKFITKRRSSNSHLQVISNISPKEQNRDPELSKINTNKNSSSNLSMEMKMIMMDTVEEIEKEAVVKEEEVAGGARPLTEEASTTRRVLLSRKQVVFDRFN
jgi:hypothetical protein